MKNNSLFNSLGCSNILGYNLFVEQNGFKIDFSRKNHLQNAKSSNEEISIKKRNISNFLILALLFLFTNFLFAQQPACNLSGPLKAQFSTNGGEIVTITSEVINVVPSSVYIWSFKTNTSNATFASENGRNSIKVNSGTKGGGYTLELKLVNRSTEGTRNLNSCNCTQSISVNN